MDWYTCVSFSFFVCFISQAQKDRPRKASSVDLARQKDLELEVLCN